MPRRKRSKKVETSEDWCFVCKDGGELRLCDKLRCPKVYHITCLQTDEASVAAETKWSCNWHFCHVCNKTSKFFCLCCPFGVCKTCLYDSHIAVLRGIKGLCSSCLELAWLIETKKYAESDESKIELNDPEEISKFWFTGYWQKIKDKARLSTEKVISAYDLWKKGEMHKGASNAFDSDEFDEDTDGFEDESLFSISDYNDSIDTEEYKQPLHWNRKRKRSNGTMSQKRGKKSNLGKLAQLQNSVDKATLIEGKIRFSKCTDSLPSRHVSLVEVPIVLGDAQEVEPGCEDFTKMNQRECNGRLPESHPESTSSGNAASRHIQLEQPQQEIAVVTAVAQEQRQIPFENPDLLQEALVIFVHTQGAEHDGCLPEPSPGGNSDVEGTPCHILPAQPEHEVPVMTAESQEQQLMPLQQPLVLHEMPVVTADAHDVEHASKHLTSTSKGLGDDGLLGASPARTSGGNGTSGHRPSEQAHHVAIEDPIVAAVTQDARSARVEFKRADGHNLNYGLTESYKGSYEGNGSSWSIPQEQPENEIPVVLVNEQGARTLCVGSLNHNNGLMDFPGRTSGGNGMACHVNYSLADSSSPLSATSKSHQEAVPVVAIDVKDEMTKDFNQLSEQKAFFANLHSMLHESLEHPRGSSQKPAHTPEQIKALHCLQHFCSLSFEQLMNHDQKDCFLSSLNFLLMSGCFPESMLGTVTSLQLNFLNNTILYSSCLENVRKADGECECAKSLMEERECAKSLMEELAEKNKRFDQSNNDIQVTVGTIHELKMQLREKRKCEASLRKKLHLFMNHH